MNGSRLRWVRIAMGAVGAFYLIGCMSQLSRARLDFRSARYSEARVALVQLEPELQGWDVETQASYALYRGLTHGALGDKLGARPWLRLAKQAYDRDHAVLDADDQTRLKLALEGVDTTP
jgi:hypothetical protein